MTGNSRFPILLLEDDDNDAFLLRCALQKAEIKNPMHRVRDGQEGIQYMSGHGEYADRERFPLPRIILCDLKMPRTNGLEFLAWLKERPELKSIPTMVLTSSREEKDVTQAYKSGVSTYFLKPGSVEDMKALLIKIRQYWTAAIKPSDLTFQPR
jgi:CheY-like chemotaxis protein